MRLYPFRNNEVLVSHAVVLNLHTVVLLQESFAN